MSGKEESNPAGTVIAQGRIWASDLSRGEFSIDVHIGRPYEISPDEWACPVQLLGLYSKLSDQHGVDSFQALMLAQNQARSLLTAFIEDGGTLRDSPDGHPVNIQSLFTSGTAS
jgi:hypothetical protein